MTEPDDRFQNADYYTCVDGEPLSCGTVAEALERYFDGLASPGTDMQQCIEGEGTVTVRAFSRKQVDPKLAGKLARRCADEIVQAFSEEELGDPDEDAGEAFAPAVMKDIETELEAVIRPALGRGHVWACEEVGQREYSPEEVQAILLEHYPLWFPEHPLRGIQLAKYALTKEQREELSLLLQSRPARITDLNLSEQLRLEPGRCVAGDLLSAIWRADREHWRIGLCEYHSCSPEPNSWGLFLPETQAVRCRHCGVLVPQGPELTYRYAIERYVDWEKLVHRMNLTNLTGQRLISLLQEESQSLMPHELAVRLSTDRTTALLIMENLVATGYFRFERLAYHSCGEPPMARLAADEEVKLPMICSLCDQDIGEEQRTSIWYDVMVTRRP